MCPVRPCCRRYGFKSYPYVSVHRVISQIVALKFIPKRGKSENELRALEREIAIMSKLRHKNIISLYECIETDSEVSKYILDSTCGWMGGSSSILLVCRCVL